MKWSKTEQGGLNGFVWKADKSQERDSEMHRKLELCEARRSYTE